jgi:hypothetical protein
MCWGVDWWKKLNYRCWSMLVALPPLQVLRCHSCSCACTIGNSGCWHKCVNRAITRQERVGMCQNVLERFRKRVASGKTRERAGKTKYHSTGLKRPCGNVPWDPTAMWEIPWDSTDDRLEHTQRNAARLKCFEFAVLFHSFGPVQLTIRKCTV